MLMTNRWAWIPQLIVLLILVGTAGKHFDISSQSTGGRGAVTAGRLSFLSLCLSAPLAWSAGASDFYVYVSQAPTLVTTGHPSIRDLSTTIECQLLSISRLLIAMVL